MDNIIEKNPIVKYRNELNEICLKDFTPLDMDIFMVLCSEMKEKNDEIITINISDIKKKTGTTIHDNMKFINKLQETNNKLSMVSYNFNNNNGIIKLILFPTFIIDKSEMKLTVRVNKDFLYLLNNLNDKFTIFEIENFINLKSKFSKTLFRSLMQWKSIGKYETDMNELRELMDCTDKYSNKDFKRYCLNKAVEELIQSEYFEYLKMDHTSEKPKIIFKFKIKENKKIEFKKDTVKKTDFHKMEQREYDFQQLEEKILSIKNN